MQRIYVQNSQKHNFVQLLILDYNVKINDAIYDIAFF